MMVLDSGLLFWATLSAYSCQDLPAFDLNSEYSQLVTNNSRKSSNHTVVHAD